MDIEKEVAINDQVMVAGVPLSYYLESGQSYDLVQREVGHVFTRNDLVVAGFSVGLGMCSDSELMRIGSAVGGVTFLGEVAASKLNRKRLLGK